MPALDFDNTTRDAALALDAGDALARYRDEFEIPKTATGQPVRYFTGNSLGLQPKRARRAVEDELKKWAEMAVHGHFADSRPWYSYHENCEESGAKVVGAKPGEVVVMNSLTTNLHLLMVSFYRPEKGRSKILTEEHPFPSDRYALDSQIRFHGFDPAEDLLFATPPEGQHVIDDDQIIDTIETRGHEIALVMLAGVNYLSGQLFDLGRIAEAARRAGCAVGFDLAHAAGNAPLSLHDWDCDFAVWCHYKYMNSGPGAVAGAFVHERHEGRADLPRFSGWWGNDPKTRFSMDTEKQFVPYRSAESWQLSNPPVLALAPVIESLDLFSEATMPALRAKSERLTGYLEYLLEQRAPRIEVITPREPHRRGCQLSLRTPDAKALTDALDAVGVVCDFRPPDVMRVAPVPLYNTFEDVWHLVDGLAAGTE